MLNKHMQQYLGNSMKLDKIDGRFFILWSHIRSFFYTYTYAFGQLVSKSLAQRVKNDPQNIEQVIEFLSAGSSARPKDILLKAKIDVSDPSFFKMGLKNIENDLDLLEKLAK